MVGFIKGKSAIHLARVYSERKRNFVGQHFWARGSFVSTVGRDETVIREYIERQEEADTQLDQLGVEDEQARYVAAIAVARNVDVLARALQDREHQRTRVLHELASLNTLAQLGQFDRKRIEADLYGRVHDWRQTLRRQMPLSRQVVAHLLDGRIVWPPRRDEGLYEFRGRVKFDGLVNGLVVTQGVTSPTGPATLRKTMLSIGFDFDGTVRLVA